ncbi:MAG: hypothetical protein PVI90_14460 [Desulfobacteraceae bacterium]|jgi:hypothetical protein
MRKVFLFVLIMGLFLLGNILPAAAEFKTKVKDWDVTLGGMIVTDTYFVMHDKNYPGSGHHVDDDADFYFWTEDTAFFATFENGPFRVYFDIRTDQFEYAYAEWDFGSGKLLFGHNEPLTWEPIHMPPPLKSGIGQMVGPPLGAQVKLSVPVGPVTLHALAIEQDYYYSYIDVGTGTVEQDAELPILETKVDIPIGPVTTSLLGGYSSYAQVDGTGKSYDITSTLVGLAAHYVKGPFSLHGTLFHDVNDYNHGGDWRQKSVLYGASCDLYFGGPSYDEESDSIKDSEYIGWALSTSYLFSPKFDLHLGVSGGNTEDDYGNKDGAIGYEIAAGIHFNQFVSVIPFFHITDWGTREPVDAAEIDEGTTTCFGAEWFFLW